MIRLQHWGYSINTPMHRHAKDDTSIICKFLWYDKPQELEVISYCLCLLYYLFLCVRSNTQTIQAQTKNNNFKLLCVKPASFSSFIIVWKHERPLKKWQKKYKKHINLTSAQNLHLWKLSSLTKPFIFSFVFCCFAILFTLVTQSEHVRNITQLYTSKSEQFLNLSDKVKRQITTLSGQGSWRIQYNSGHKLVSEYVGSMAQMAQFSFPYYFTIPNSEFGNLHYEFRNSELWSIYYMGKW